MDERISVRVPATSANLGCAFDCAALALNLYLDIHLTPRADRAVTIRYTGVTPERISTDSTNLIARTIWDTLEAWKKPRGFDLEIENQIPVAAGLGSSAAAIVGALAACHWLAERPLSDEELLTLATRLEGHPDNAAAAWHGGFTVALEEGGRILAYSCPVPDSVHLVLVVPNYAVPTEKAREVLPAEYSRPDAVHNMQRAVALAAQFFSAKPEFRRSFFNDHWHQPYRAPLVPGLTEVLHHTHPDLLGICLSGAGPSVLAFARDNAEAVGEDIRQLLAQHGIESQVRCLAADNLGAKGWNRIESRGDSEL
jgi:homoserine kinase